MTQKERGVAPVNEGSPFTFETEERGAMERARKFMDESVFSARTKYTRKELVQKAVMHVVPSLVTSYPVDKATYMAAQLEGYEPPAGKVTLTQKGWPGNCVVFEKEFTIREALAYITTTRKHPNVWDFIGVIGGYSYKLRDPGAKMNSFQITVSGKTFDVRAFYAAIYLEGDKLETFLSHRGL